LNTIFPIVCHAPASASQLSWNQSICVSSEYRLAAWADYIGALAQSPSLFLELDEISFHHRGPALIGSWFV
jgi:hypothetical protein